ncbi:MAG: ATP-binding cassette domain-containing protein [Bacteroidales bacterium]
MNNPVIKIIVQLFAIFVNIDKNYNKEEVVDILHSYLSHYLTENKLQEFVAMFQFYNSQYADKIPKNFNKDISIKSVKILRLVDSLNKSLIHSEKIFLFSHLVELLKLKHSVLPDEKDILNTIAWSFKIPDEEIDDLETFILEGCEKVNNKERLLLVTADESGAERKFLHFIKRHNLSGEICFLHIFSANLFIFYYYGEDTLFLNGLKINPGKVYKFSKGNAISSYKLGFQNVKLKSLYYTEIAQRYIIKESKDNVELILDNVGFKYKNSNIGIKPFRFKTESFYFVGVIGSSGVGKSTLLNIINGNLTPDNGSIKINGYDVHKNIDKLKGLIGYVPQDDLLFEELTVFQNLYYNARLCFDTYHSEEIQAIVEETLSELNLKEIKNSRVGSPMDNQISGGQRKRVNLALEMIRQPSVLLVDEPTSGLSSSDSLHIMNLLREQTLKGRLVIVNIHQPSSGIFKLFDQLIVLDHGGTPVYTGDPMEGLVYFKTLDQQVHAEEKECPTCGNISPEIILEILEDKEIDENGNYTSKRKRTPDDWYQLYKEHIEKPESLEVQRSNIPENPFKQAGLLKQFSVFFTRNLVTKLVNKQYLLISLIEAPLLAFILAFFSKYTLRTESEGFNYLFSENVNLPSYLLMSIIVAMFIGMLLSAGEIIRDRKVLEREKFLNLSRSGYLLSKITLLLFLSGFQIFTYVIIGNYILEIRGLTYEYWMILFSVAIFSNLAGLNISSGLNSQVAIYILIPFLLIPQILLSGTIIKFDNLHGKLTSDLYPPFIADLMVSRWSFEALTVEQFMSNKYEKQLYNIEKEESNYYYEANIYIPEILEYLDEIQTYITYDNSASNNINNSIEIINNELNKIEDKFPEMKNNLDNIDQSQIEESKIINLKKTLNTIRQDIAIQLDSIMYKKDKKLSEIIHSNKGKDNFRKFKQKYHNKAIAELVKGKENTDNILFKNSHLKRKFEPVYYSPELKNGRAHFFAPEKQVGPWSLYTFNFNLAVIWLFNLILYIALYYNLLRKAIYKFQKKTR